MSGIKRFSAKEKTKVDSLFPKAFTLYKRYMGGVDLYDAYCSNLMPCIRAKKWTWGIFVRLIQSSLTNTTVLQNMAQEGKKVGTKDIGSVIAKWFLFK